MTDRLKCHICNTEKMITKVDVDIANGKKVRTLECGHSSTLYEVGLEDTVEVSDSISVEKKKAE